MLLDKVIRRTLLESCKVNTRRLINVRAADLAAALPADSKIRKVFTDGGETVEVSRKRLQAALPDTNLDEFCESSPNSRYVRAWREDLDELLPRDAELRQLLLVNPPAQPSKKTKVKGGKPTPITVEKFVEVDRAEVLAELERATAEAAEAEAIASKSSGNQAPKTDPQKPSDGKTA